MNTTIDKLGTSVRSAMVYSGYMENQAFSESCVLRTQYINKRAKKNLRKGAEPYPLST